MDLFKQHALLNKEGFTLIEVLISILLLAFISLNTFRMVDHSTDTKDEVVREDRVLLQSLTAVARLDSDFGQLYSPLYAYAKANAAVDPNAVYQDNATSNGSFDGKSKNGMLIPQFKTEDKSNITFFTAANRRKIADLKESRFAWVKYSLRRAQTENEENNGKKEKIAADLELIRQSISTNIYATDLNWSDVKAQVLLSHVRSLEFSFWDEKTKKFVPSLLDLNENKNIIRAIKMDLVWVDENNVEQKVQKVYRVLFPYFNAKLDDLKAGGAYGGGNPPPGVSDPADIDGAGQGGPGGQGGSGVHF